MDMLIAKARAGDQVAIGNLFEHYRPFLIQIANDEIDPNLKRKIGGSDLVQQSFLEANHSFDSFVGGTANAFEAWLRRILLNNVANLRRHYKTDKRNVSREVELAGTDSRAIKLETLVANPTSDSKLLARQEELLRVARALERLSPTQRSVIQLRSHERRSFQDIGDQIGRSAEATRKIWARAIESLKTTVDDTSNPKRVD